MVRLGQKASEVGSKAVTRDLVLETVRLRLRRFRREDVDAVFAVHRG